TELGPPVNTFLLYSRTPNNHAAIGHQGRQALCHHQPRIPQENCWRPQQARRRHGDSEPSPSERSNAWS
ncbi:hypothetical protein P7K49_033718, partial [Saguinus oedipus]